MGGNLQHLLAERDTVAPSAHPEDATPFGPALALTLAIAITAMGLVLAVMVLAVAPKPIPGLAASQRQDAESSVFMVCLLFVVPIAVIVGPRVAAAIARGPNSSALSALAAVGLGGLAATAIGVRVLDASVGSGEPFLLAALVVWTAAGAIALRRASRPAPWPGLIASARHAGVLWYASAALGALVPLVVTHPRSVSALPLLLAAIAAPVTVLAARRPRRRLGARAELALELLALALVLLTIPDLVVVRPEDPNLPELDRYLSTIMQFHHDFLIGPANQMLAGDMMLRDTASQYGVGSLYFLAGWLKVLTVSYGSFALLDGVLTAIWFAAAYGVLRAARCRPAVAGAALAVSVVALVFNRVYAVGMLPQEGPFRFGLPMGVLLGAVVAIRLPRWAGAGRTLSLATLAVSAVWSFEAFAGAAFVFLAASLTEAVIAPAGGRRRLFARRLVAGGAAVLAAHVLFAAATLVLTGHLPDWGQYIAFLREFLLGDLGDLTYDFSRWSPGIALGVVYLGSVIALLVVLRLRPAQAALHRGTIVAVGGTSAYGLVQFWYLVDRSADHVVVYVALPALMLAALWLSLVLSCAPAGGRRIAVALAATTGTLLVSVGWSSIQRPLDRSALVHLVPGGQNTRAALARLRAFPAIDPRAPEGERLLDEHMPGERRSLVITEPNLSVEILIRRQRANVLPISNPREDDFTPNERLPGVLDAVRRLKPGRRILLDTGALATLQAIRRDPRAVVLRQGDGRVALVQARALQAINRRFRLRLVRRGGAGLAVFELMRRR